MSFTQNSNVILGLMHGCFNPFPHPSGLLQTKLNFCLKIQFGLHQATEKIKAINQSIFNPGTTF